MKTLYATLATAASVLALAAPASAQETAAPTQAQEATNAEGEIIVTANRTESALSRTPIAVTALTAEALVNNGVTTTTALADYVPNLQLTTHNSGTQITIRGITNEDATERADPSAAFMLDDVYLGRPAAVEVSMFDVARVEVLRGPQGTLYGRNTTAGLINIITNRPDFEEFGGSADVLVGNYATVQSTFVLNVPLTDNLAVRAAVNFDQRDNYIETGGAFTSNTEPYKDNVSGRLSLLHDWGSGEILLRADYSHMGGSPMDVTPRDNYFGPNAIGVDPEYIGGDREDLLVNNAPITWELFRDNETWGAGGQLTQSLGPVDVIYLGAFRRFHRNEADPRINASGANAYRLEWHGEYDQFSHELRFASNTDGPLQWQAGVYKFEEDIQQQLTLLLTPNVEEIGNTVEFRTPSLTNDSWAVFGQATYDITDRFSLTAGARYTSDAKERVGAGNFSCNTFSCDGVVVQTLTNNALAEFEETTWRVGAQYDLNDAVMLYGTVSTGYKAGGFNDGCEIGTGPGCTLAEGGLYYEPEMLTSYEMGLKGAFFDRRLRVNLAAFHYNFENMQLFQLIADCGGGASCSATTNAGEAEVQGIELDGTFAVGDNGRIEYGATLLDSEFVEFVPGPGFDFSGRPLGKTPEWTLTAGYAHTFPLASGGEWELAARTRVSEEYYLLSINQRAYYTQPGFSRTDATATYHSPDDRWYLQAFVRNIEDEVPVTTVITGTRTTIGTQAPRTWGLRFGADF